MKFVKEFTKAVAAYGKVLSFVNKHQIWSFYLLPLLFNTLLTVAFLFFAYSFFGQFILLLEQLILPENTDGWIFKVFGTVLSLMIWLLGVFLFISVYQTVSLIVFSPIFSYLMEKTQEALYGKTIPFSINKLINDAIRGIRIALKNFVIQMAIYLILYLLMLILPFIAPLFALILFIVNAYFLGFSMIDYRNECYGMTEKDSRTYIRNKMGVAIGNGSMFSLLLTIPLIGTLFAPVFAVVAAGLSLHEEK